MGTIKRDLGCVYALYSIVLDDLGNKDSRIPKCTIQIIFRMNFIHTNVATFSFGTLYVMLINFMIELFIIIFIQNLKDSNCILISRKEGSINPSKYFCYVSSSYTSIAPYSYFGRNSCKLFSKNALNEDFGVEYGTKTLDSTITYPLECVVQESGPVNIHKHGIKQTYDQDGAQITKTKTKLQNSDARRVHSLSDIDIGLVTNVDCNRILDIKSIFEDAFGDESSEIYGLYKEKLLKLLANELDVGGYSNSLDLLYNRWKTMDNVAMSRGYRILLTDHWANKEFTTLVQTLVRTIPSRFVTDIYSFEIGMRAINRAYIDGWVLSLALVSIMKSFGIEYFKRVSVFRDFRKSTLDEIGEFKNAKNKYKRNLGYELHDTNKKRSESMDSVYNNAIYSCFNSRKFVTLMSLYFEKLSMNHSINTELDPNYNLYLNEDDKMKLKEFLENNEDPIGSGFDELIENLLSLMPNTDVSYDFDVIHNHMFSLKSLEPTQMKASDWSIYLILKHTLSNIFSTDEITFTNPDSSDETFTKFGNNDPKLTSLLQCRTNLDNMVSYLRDLLISILKPSFFCKNRSSSDTESSLESTIHYIRGFETSGNLLGVAEIYELMRLLLRHNVSGATALNMMFMLVPKLVFSNWCHYHMFVCCLEHDIERGDLDSIDELLQYMIKLNCIPDAGLYERYFGMCNSLDKPLLVMKHFDIICKNGINWEETDRYTSQKKIRISFGMYEQIFISCLKTGNVERGMEAMKNLLGALKGAYKLIPSSTWKDFTKLMETTQVDKSITAILNQISSSSTPVEGGMTTPISVEIPRHKSVIIKQIEEILDKYTAST